jgi:hypothetical protein
MSARDLFVYRTQTWKTSWLLRLLLVGGCGFLLLGTKSCWVPVVGGSVVHKGPIVQSDALLLDNLDEDYSVYDKAGQLQRRSLAARVVIPVVAGRGSDSPSPYALPIVEVMSRMARLENAEFVTYGEEEPVSLNVAKQVLGHLQQTGTRSVLVISPGFRSERAYRVYDSVLGPAGIHVSCLPVFGKTTPDNWAESWHGIQDVALQFGKLWYYRLVVGI